MLAYQCGLKCNEKVTKAKAVNLKTSPCDISKEALSSLNLAQLTIPQKCGVIILPDGALFPHGTLPLHLFEPRYREMAQEALRGDCMFCVGNQIHCEEKEQDGVAPVGTIGLIRSARELPDGRLYLLLHGIVRVRFQDWIPNKKPYPYAVIEPEITQVPPHLDELGLRTLLDKAVLEVLKYTARDVQEEISHVLSHIDELEVRADLIAQQFVNDPESRQELIEETDLSKRLLSLSSILKNILG